MCAKGYKEMNVLLVSHRFYKESKAGTEVLVEDVAKELRRLGHTVCLLAASDNLINGDIDIEYRKDGIITIAISTEFQRNPADRWEIVGEKQLKKVQKAVNLLDIQFDIVHIFHFVRIGLSFFKLSCFRNSKLYVTLTDYSLFCPDYQLFNRKGNCMCTNLKNEIFCARCLDNQFVSTDIKRWREYNRNFINQNAVKVYTQTYHQMLNMKEFGVHEEILSDNYAYYKTPDSWCDYCRSKKGRFTFAFLGRISLEKAPHTIINAFKNLNYPNEKLLICGSNDDEAYFSEIIKSIEGRSDITYYPPVSLKELGNIFCQIDCLLFPSVWDENNSLLISYATSMNIPVLCSAVPSLRELKQQNIHFIEQYKNEESWKNAIKLHIKSRTQLPQNIEGKYFIKSQEAFYQHFNRIINDYENDIL